MDILTRGGRRVYWVGNPIMRDFGYRGRIAMMNHIYQAEAKKHPGVTFISTWQLMANDKGSYSDYLKDAGGQLGAHARAGRHPPHARRRRPHGRARARRDREGLGHERRVGVAQPVAVT